MWRWLDIRGRGSVGEFWLIFFLYLIFTAYAVLGLSSSDVQGAWRGALIAVVWIALLVLWLAAIRRVHDLSEHTLTSLFVVAGPLALAASLTLMEIRPAFLSLDWAPYAVVAVSLLSVLATVIGLYAMKDDGDLRPNRFGPARGSRRRAARIVEPTIKTPVVRGWRSWFAPGGRGSRTTLLVVGLLWLAAVMPLLWEARTGATTSALAVLGGAFAVLLTPWLVIAAVRRAHDLGWHGRIALLAGPGPIFFLLSYGLGFGIEQLLVFYLGAPLLILALTIVTFPGQDRANPYGESLRPPRLTAKRGGAVERSEDFVRLRRRMTRNVSQALTTMPTDAVAASWLGGAPLLPPGVPWPEHAGQPLSFVAQLDLAEVREAGGPEWLPPDGALSFFLALDEAPYGERLDAATAWRVIHHPADQKLERRVLGSSAVAVWPERRIVFKAVRSLPSPDWLGVDVTELDVDDDELDALADLPSTELGDGPEHLVGGYPGEIQDGRMNLSCALAAAGHDPQADHPAEVMQRALRDAKHWRLLLQLDYDADLGMRWPGSGRFYFFVREKDALKGDFSQARLLNQFS